MLGRFSKKTPYTDGLLAAGDATLFVAGIQADPKRYFAEARRNPRRALRALAGVLEMAHHSLGQTALLLSLTGTLKVAAKDVRAPKSAIKTAEALSSELLRILKEAG